MYKRQGPGSSNLQTIDISSVSNRFITEDSAAKYVFVNQEKKLMRTRDGYNKEYVLTEESIPLIKWDITNESKQILDYVCYKAHTNFRGRTYTAWFTNQIPILSGPWKFSGLPGLILEITSDDNQVMIVASEIQIPSLANIPSSFIETGEKLTMEEYFMFVKRVNLRSCDKNVATINTIKSMDNYKNDPSRYTASIEMLQKSCDIAKRRALVSFLIEKRY